MRHIFYISSILLFMLFGYIIGDLRFNPDWQLAFHEAGFIPFCDLNETDRLRVCPLMRVTQELSTGGSLVFYQCNNKEGYIETVDLTVMSNSNVTKNFNALPSRPSKKCDTTRGEIFHVQKKAKIYKLPTENFLQPNV